MNPSKGNNAWIHNINIMRQYFNQGYSKFSFKRIVTKTEKATLFEIIPKIEIWLPNSWLIKLTKTSFTVKDHIATDVKLKMNAEFKALKK
jgi:hypothetical protein